jgi:nucleolar MIF4G domain-containing protein 1
MKAQVTAVKGGRAANSTGLRISLKDILDIETKGRWWKVGAIWKGNQYRPHDDTNGESGTDGSKPPNELEIESKESVRTSEKQKQLLKLAKKQRMNSDLRRSIFCIIMGSNDCQEALQSFIQNDMFIGKSDREIVRVLVHCCGSEKVYNPYYAHLADRVCAYQSNCKFTFQLTFWDSFQQFDNMKARKAANLSKLLAYLLIKGHLNLNVLKPMDITPDDMAESAIIFLTILFTTLLEELNADELKFLFQRGDGGGKMKEADLFEGPGQDIDEDDLYVTAGSEREALKENISIFLMHYLEASPKNVKQSNFRKNLKVSIKACESDGLDGMF